jgi:hypothetical protein
MELIAFRKSPIFINRITLDPNYESPVTVIHNQDGSFGLGVMVGMKSNPIFYGYMHNGILRWSGNADEGEEALIKKIESLKTYKGKIRRLTHFNIPSDALAFGLHEKTLYVASCPNSYADDVVIRIINDIVEHTENKDRNTTIESIAGEYSFEVQDCNKISRVYGKTAINVLAHVAGVDYVKSSAFDRIRNWIITGEDKEFFHKPPKIGYDITMIQLLPKNAHWCLFINIGNLLVAEVCYHGSAKKAFALGEITEWKSSFPDGYICDWQNKKEYRLLDWVVAMPH